MDWQKADWILLSVGENAGQSLMDIQSSWLGDYGRRGMAISIFRGVNGGVCS